METRTFESKSSAAIYTAQFDPATGESSCDCPGWRFKKANTERGCSHTRQMGQRAAAMAEVDWKRASDLAEFGIEPISLLPAPKEICSPAKTEDAVKPMLASAMTNQTLADFCGNPEWALEEKFDGHRVMVRKQGEKVSAWSRPRSGKDALQRTLPAGVIDALRELPDGFYDGEIVSPGGHSWDVARLDTKATQLLILFDVVELLGQSVVNKPYSERHALLALAVAHHAEHTEAVRVLATVSRPVSVKAVESIWNRGGEGAILKRLSSTYQPGRRSPDWLKVKKEAAETLTITGFEPGKSGPCSTVALRSDDGRTTTVKVKDNATIAAAEANPGAFIGKRLVVSYCERTDSGSLRHGMWDHLAGEGE